MCSPETGIVLSSAYSLIGCNMYMYIQGPILVTVKQFLHVHLPVSMCRCSVYVNFDNVSFCYVRFWRDGVFVGTPCGLHIHLHVLYITVWTYPTDGGIMWGTCGVCDDSVG